MKRRGFIGMIAAVAGAGVSGVKAGARTVREELRKVRLLRKAVETPSICTRDFMAAHNERSVDDSLTHVGMQVNNAIKILMEQGATSIDLRWVNIPDPEINPEGIIGRFRLVGMKCDDPTIRACDLQVRETADRKAIAAMFDDKPPYTVEEMQEAGKGLTWERPFK